MYHKKDTNKWKVLVVISAMFLAIPLTYYLGQNSQDIRQYAYPGQCTGLPTCALGAQCSIVTSGTCTGTCGVNQTKCVDLQNQSDNYLYSCCSAPQSSSLPTSITLSGRILCSINRPIASLSWNRTSTFTEIFYVERCEGTSCPNFTSGFKLKETLTNSTSWSDKTIVGGRYYKYRVRSDKSPYSNTVGLLAKCI